MFRTKPVLDLIVNEIKLFELIAVEELLRPVTFRELPQAFDAGVPGFPNALALVNPPITRLEAIVVAD